MDNQKQYEVRDQYLQEQKRNGVSPAFIAKVIAEQQTKEPQPQQ
jgi:hypothetical protein